MNEQAPESPSQPEPHYLTAEELQQGYTLQPEETVTASIVPEGGGATRKHSIGNGVEITGQTVAEIRIGGQETHTRVSIINTFNAPDRHEEMLVIHTPDQPIAMKLERGQMWGLGRRFEGQGNLPDTVSGDHCAVGLDENGQLVVENHNPTNFTGLWTFNTREPGV